MVHLPYPYSTISLCSLCGFQETNSHSCIIPVVFCETSSKHYKTSVYTYLSAIMYLINNIISREINHTSIPYFMISGVRLKTDLSKFGILGIVLTVLLHNLEYCTILLNNH